MREPKNQMLGTMEPPLMQLSVKLDPMSEQNTLFTDNLFYTPGVTLMLLLLSRN